MPRPRQRSVRRQLLILLLSAVSGAWVVAASVSFRDARHEVSEVLDAHLAQTASLISAQRDGDKDHAEVDTEHAPVLHRYCRRVMFQVWEGGAVLGLHFAECVQYAALADQGWIQRRDNRRSALACVQHMGRARSRPRAGGRAFL